MTLPRLQWFLFGMIQGFWRQQRQTEKRRTTGQHDQDQDSRSSRAPNQDPPARIAMAEHAVDQPCDGQNGREFRDYERRRRRAFENGRKPVSEIAHRYFRRRVGFEGCPSSESRFSCTRFSSLSFSERIRFSSKLCAEPA